MDSAFRKFYRSLFQSTGGFLPTIPLNLAIYPGDFFQIKNGELIVLGNIFRQQVIHNRDARLEYGLSLHSQGWEVSEGVSKPYSGRGTGKIPIDEEFEYSRQVLAFSEAGSFMFNGREPELIRIANWRDLREELIVKMTCTQYSFRDVYVVTDSVTTASWTLAISGNEEGELEIATDHETYGLIDIFGFPETRTIQLRNIAYYHQEVSRKPLFFRARKLEVQNDQLETFISELIGQEGAPDNWASNFFAYDFAANGLTTPPRKPALLRTSVLDMLQANQLNPNNALDYFRWAQMHLDDIEEFFPRYGK